MNKHLLILAALCLCSLPNILLAQAPQICLFNAADQAVVSNRLEKNLQFLDQTPAQDRSGVRYVPIAYHLLGESDGTFRASLQKVLAMHCALNELMAATDIQFYMVEMPQAFDNSGVFNNHASSGSAQILDGIRHSGALNIYVTKYTNPNLVSSAFIPAYYNTAKDWIVSYPLKPNEIHFLAHEIGHFFSLLHTYTGWKIPDYWTDANDTTCAPLLLPNGLEVEKMDGSNCHTAADRICDTPPDYGIAISAFQTDCIYFGKAQDPDCTPINPDFSNMMSLLAGDCDYHFSAEQIQVMLADLDSPARDYLDNTFAANSVIDLVNLVSPINNQVVNDYLHVPLDWDAVPNADQYLIEISRAPSFPDGLTLQFVATASELVLVDTLLPNQTYFWRVKPFNAYSVCGLFSQNTFKTGNTTQTDVVANELKWLIYPNPVQHGETLTIQSGEKTEHLLVSMFDFVGNPVFENNIMFGNQISIPNNCPNGAYILKIMAPTRPYFEKIYIQSR